MNSLVRINYFASLFSNFKDQTLEIPLKAFKEH